MTEPNNETPNMNSKVEQMLHEIEVQLRELTARVNEWIMDTGGDGGIETRCSSPCDTPTAAIQTAPKRRGRPPKTAACANVSGGDVATVAPKRRGRPPKVKTEEEIQAELNAPPKRRGRPPKNTTTVEVQDSTSTPKRRGRPPKTAVNPPELSEEEEAWQEVDEAKASVAAMPNVPSSMPPAFASVNPPPMPPPAFPPGAPAFPLA